MQDTFILSLKNSYNNYAKTIADNNTITIKDLENKLKVDLDNIKQKYKLNTKYKYTPEETKEAIQTNFNNGLYNISFGSSPKEVFSNYKSERNLLSEKKQQDVELIEKNTTDQQKPFNDQTLLAINQYKDAQKNNLNNINNTRRSLKGSPHVQLSKYKTHKNTEMQSNVTDLSTEYNTPTTMVGNGYCCCLTPDEVNGICYSAKCGSKGYDKSGALGCCGAHTYDPETANCCSGTMFCSYYSVGTNSVCQYNNITLSDVSVDGSCTDGFKWAGYIHWNSAYHVAFVDINNISAVNGACAYAMQCGQGYPGSHSIPCSSVGGYPYGPGQFFSAVTTQSQTNSSITLP